MQCDIEFASVDMEIDFCSELDIFLLVSYLHSAVEMKTDRMFLTSRQLFVLSNIVLALSTFSFHSVARVQVTQRPQLILELPDLVELETHAHDHL